MYLLLGWKRITNLQISIAQFDDTGHLFFAHLGEEGESDTVLCQPLCVGTIALFTAKKCIGVLKMTGDGIMHVTLHAGFFHV